MTTVNPLERPCVATPVDPVDLAIALMHAWRRRRGEYPTRRTLCVLLSQSALETRRWLSMWGNNLGNVKSTMRVEPFYFKDCTELLRPADAKAHLVAPVIGRDGKPSVRFVRKNKEGQVSASGVSLETWTLSFHAPHPACAFRWFETLDEGVEFYLTFLEKKYAPAWEHVIAGDPAAFVKALKARGYFTADLEEYMTAVVSIFTEFLRLPFVLPSEESQAIARDDVDLAAIEASVAATLQGLSWSLLAEDGRTHV